MSYIFYARYTHTVHTTCQNIIIIALLIKYSLIIDFQKARQSPTTKSNFHICLMSFLLKRKIDLILRSYFSSFPNEDSRKRFLLINLNRQFRVFSFRISLFNGRDDHKSTSRWKMCHQDIEALLRWELSCILIINWTFRVH